MGANAECSANPTFSIDYHTFQPLDPTVRRAPSFFLPPSVCTAVPIAPSPQPNHHHHHHAPSWLVFGLCVGGSALLGAAAMALYFSRKNSTPKKPPTEYDSLLDVLQ